jgi:hypothetical protein
MNWLFFGGAVGSSMIAYGVTGLWRERNIKACLPPDSPEAPECLTLEELAPIWREKPVPIKEAKKESPPPESEEPEEPSEPFF